MALVPSAIPGVELLDELGRGAHSVVYRARREGRYYAIKLPLEGETGAKAKLLTQRFLREAVALARVKHSSLPAVMEVGQVNRLPYIIMELAAGETLAARLERAPLDELQVVRLGAQLADALGHIHQSGLVHRDVKPKNILFDSQTTAVRLVDFGFAVSSVAGIGPEARAGTLAYAAPEQVSGVRERVDGRADLYSLGCVLFECIVGSPPFVELDPRRLLHQHEQLPAPDPSAIVPGVSKLLNAVLVKLLSRNPDDRYPSALALRDDLRRLERALEDGGEEPPLLEPSAPYSGTFMPLVGRETELRRLRTAWAEAREGHGQVIVVKGAAGSGKSRLVEALVEDARGAGAAVITATCQPIDPQPFSAIRQLLEAHVRGYDTLPAPKRLRALARLRSVAGDLAPLLAVISPTLSRVFNNAAPVPHAEDAEHVFTEGLSEFMSKLLLELGPSVVVVDDVQWIDGNSRRVLARAADRAAASPVLYVFAARSDERSRALVERLTGTLRKDRLSSITLGPLPQMHVVDLVHAYLGRAKVDPELLRYVTSLSDGTPLGVLEILRTMLEAGVLVPYWGRWRLDRDAVEKMELSGETASLLDRRIADLDAMTLTTLTAAAVIGKSFDDALLKSVCDLEEGHVNAALAEARRALLVEGAPRGVHRFLHDSVREALLKRLTPEARRILHQRVAEALDEGGGKDGIDIELLGHGAVLGDELAEATRELEEQLALPSNRLADASRADFCYALATHYWHGERDKNPRRVFDTSLLAGKLAFRSFDNERALSFFEAASEAARILEIPSDPELDFTAGEAHLRTGALEASLAEFQKVVESSSEPLLQALALSRIAWVNMQLDSAGAWPAARAAFEKLGTPAPTGSVVNLIVSALLWFWFSRFPAAVIRGASERRRLEGVCALYYLSARLALPGSKPTIMIEAALRLLVAAQQLGPSAAQTRGYLLYGFVLSALGLRAASVKYLTMAENIASQTGDPTVLAHALQVHCTSAAWAGDMRRALETGARATEEYGHWRELSDFCLVAYNLQQIEAVRGRSLEAWKWIDVSIQRLTKHERAPSVLDYMELSARATLTALGRESEADTLLQGLRSVTVRPSGGNVLVFAYGARVRIYTERGDTGPEFEEVVAKVRAVYPDPKKAHLEVKEFYIHAAHARVHACLRAPESERGALVSELERAHDELASAVKNELFRGHFEVIGGYLALFRRKFELAERHFAAAARLGRSEGAPWILYAVCRGRAFLLRTLGKHDSALDQARLAEALAKDSGSAYRLKWIREEFGLRGAGRPERVQEASTAMSTSMMRSSWSDVLPSSRHDRRHLRALSRLGQATAEELEASYQARLVLDELIQTFAADAGLLFWTEPAPTTQRANGAGEYAVLGARDAHGRDIADPEYDAEALNDVISSGMAQIVEPRAHVSESAVFSGPDSSRCVLIAPLVMRSKPMGAVYLTRDAVRGRFAEADGELLTQLALQIPLALELARALLTRERAEDDARTAQKMEAIGRLAGGIAHDFNNMLAAILVASEAIIHKPNSEKVVQDAETIQSAAERARDLTRQLLAFSRGQYLSPEVIQLNAAIERLAPVFERLVGERIRLELDLAADLEPVRADPAQIDQVITNLVVNAADAMPDGGLLRIESRNTSPPRDVLASRSPQKDVPSVIVTVKDTGHGMDERTRSKIFDPFFTTKAHRSGTGLGLSTAYGIVVQSGGRIEVESEPGAGSSFHVHLPACRQPLTLPPPRSSIRDVRETTVLLVDDEPLVRESLRRMLKQLGFRVIAAAGAPEALEIVEEAQRAVDLLITDVIMPDMNGLELAREVGRLRPALPVLFISGYTNGVLTERGILRDRVEFLQKPVTLSALSAGVARILGDVKAVESKG